MNFIFDLHQTMMSQKLILVYQGDFTQETTKSILAMAERNIDSSGEDSSIKRKVFNVMVEALQNIVKHSDELIDGTIHNHSAIFLIGRESTRYTIMSGNPIRKENIGPLKDKLERINSLDKEGLKDLYKEIIKNTTISDKGGAGLGFVDMARKSGDRLEYTFPEMNAEYCFFCLKVNVQRENAE
ncbi:SiaB family protein kinase [Chryseosolibacter indicus]|uniref:SiaB family protein kinase n=1 Tax=Chryseosolibacter indicus TaxID=2782351 RepID=A0ABS5VMX5_9BACT|nr:SiaB family protein kinase [Chryseosolibacter indicus]MBT1702798.1 SiaB family protein kinase [Chryseosolibacter indicus]